MITNDKNETISICEAWVTRLLYSYQIVLSVLTFNIERQEFQWIMSLSIIDSIPFMWPMRFEWLRISLLISINPVMSSPTIWICAPSWLRLWFVITIKIELPFSVCDHDFNLKCFWLCVSHAFFLSRQPKVCNFLSV